jgi:hypothetical protein
MHCKVLHPPAELVAVDATSEVTVQATSQVAENRPVKLQVQTFGQCDPCKYVSPEFAHCLNTAEHLDASLQTMIKHIYLNRGLPQNLFLYLETAAAPMAYTWREATGVGTCWQAICAEDMANKLNQVVAGAMRDFVDDEPHKYTGKQRSQMNSWIDTLDSGCVKATLGTIAKGKHLVESLHPVSPKGICSSACPKVGFVPFSQRKLSGWVKELCEKQADSGEDDEGSESSA